MSLAACFIHIQFSCFETQVSDSVSSCTCTAYLPRAKGFVPSGMNLSIIRGVSVRKLKNILVLVVFFVLLLQGLLRLRHEPKAKLQLMVEQAEQGDVDTMATLGRWYIGGHRGAVATDKKEAIVWLRRAAEHGHADSAFQLQNLLAFGELKDNKESYAWLAVAASNDQRNEASYKRQKERLSKNATLFAEYEVLAKDYVEKYGSGK